MSKPAHQDGAVGTTIVSKTLASNIDDFWFSVKDGAAVRPFDFVSVKNAQKERIIGIVNDLQVIPSGKASSYSKKGTMAAKAAILANTISLAGMPVMPGRKVRLADAKEVLFALGIPEMANPVPAGVIEMTNGLQVPVALDVSYLAGPDTAHVNAAGISGCCCRHLHFLHTAPFWPCY